MRQRSALQQQMVLALALVLVLRFFNYRVVPDIPSLMGSAFGLQGTPGLAPRDFYYKNYIKNQSKIN